MMRVTHRSISDSAMRGIQGSLSRTQDLQNQLSSGKRVSRPGDDPGAVVGTLKMRGQLRGNEQYLRNMQDASGRLNATDEALQGVSDRIRRTQELVLSAANGTVSPEGLVGISTEMNGIVKEVTDLYNTRWMDRPVFGGTVAGGVAVNEATLGYVGNEAPVTARISRDSTIRVDTSGTMAGADTLPGVLKQAALDVVSNPAALSGTLTTLQSELSKVLGALGDVGARAARVATTQTHVDNERLDFTSRISDLEDVDLPDTIMKLQAQNMAYQTALGAASKVMQTSLVDFLR